MTSRKQLFRLSTIAFTLPLLVACDVTVYRQDEGRGADVEVSTPLGDVSVHTNVETTETGLPVYPGARLRRDDDSGSADVDIRAFSVGLKVVAAHFESDAPPEAIVDFYKRAMSTYGRVTECRGHVDFKGRRGARRAACRARPSSDGTQLIVGTEDRYRLVVVDRRHTRSEFAVVYITTRS